MEQKINFQLLTIYLLGGAFGFVASLFILGLFQVFEAKTHSFSYHWFSHQPPSHALIIIIGFVLAGFLASNRQITGERIKSQKTTIESLEEISQAKTEMVSFASHQMRTPLSGLKFSIKMLLDGDLGKLTENQREILTQTFEASRDLGNLIQDFLDVSKLEIGKLEISLKKINLFDLEKTIKGAVESFESALKKKNINLEYSSSLKHQLSIFLDLKRIKQIIENLLENALNYTPENGKIGIVLTNDENNFKFRIFDTGVGIPKKEQSKIFSKFFRATNAKKLQSSGTGLGLSLCKKFIEGHQGKIWFISEEEKGTTFSFTIPLKAKVEIEELFRKI